MKKRRAFEHIDGSEPMFEEMARKRKKRDDLSLLPDEDAEDIAVRFFAALDKRESAKGPPLPTPAPAEGALAPANALVSPPSRPAPHSQG